MNANRLQIFELLEVSPREILISNMEIQQWGSIWIFHCVYNADNPKMFDLVFRGCASCQWVKESEISEKDTEADVIGILLGQEHHIHPAHIQTDMFGIEIDYEELHIIKKW
ncbi:hypothetical protein ANRL4_03064 [Anaerolineae bacterium]|nr:hypothetical protein ANRL4_03064 [Anaerolineae bacterium]